MSVTYEVHDRVAVVTIDRAAKRNAMSPDVFTGLHDAARRAADEVAGDDGVGAVLVRGDGGVFSAGIDVATLAPQGSGEVSVDEELVAPLQAAFTAFEDLDVPSVAQVEGYCFGAGLQLALACHVRLVAPGAQLSLMETRWGLVPDLGGCYRLPRLVGLGRATDMALTARRVSAEEALAMGLADRLLESGEPGEEAFAYARRLASGPAAVRLVPRLVRENLERGREAALAAEIATQARATSGPDFREVFAAAAEDREPRFVGR